MPTVLSSLIAVTCMVIIYVELVWRGLMHRATDRVDAAADRFEAVTSDVEKMSQQMEAEIMACREARGAQR